MKPTVPEDVQKKRLENLLGLVNREPPAVGVTPAEVVFTENKWRLLRYEARPEGFKYRHPILMVPSLINRHYVLDLMPGKSMAAWLVAQGHDVYCLDWGTPGAEDRYLDLRDIADLYLGRAVRVATRLSGHRPNLLGYCMGGTLATVFTALHPERVASLANMAAPVRFDDDGLLTAWSKTKSFDVDALVDATGIVPWELLQSSFHLLRPTMNLGKVVNLIDRAWNDPFLDGFFALETWANDNVGLPGEFYRSWISDFYVEDRLWKGTLTVGGELAHLSSITCPTLAVAFEQDSIAPALSCECLVDAVSSHSKKAVRLPGSHVGGTTSSAAAKRLWPVLSGFFAEHDERA
jgi:polyhydroxyalkanoate synthase